jgi:hypothetical protein
MKTRPGYLGTLIKISNAIEQNSSKTEEAYTSTPEWAAYRA